MHHALAPEPLLRAGLPFPAALAARLFFSPPALPFPTPDEFQAAALIEERAARVNCGIKRAAAGYNIVKSGSQRGVTSD